MRQLCTAVLYLGLLCPLLSGQDSITLKNGDFLSGKVEGMRGGTLYLLSPLLGRVQVAFSALEQLRTKEPVLLQDKDGRRLMSRIAGLSKGNMLVATSQSAQPISIPLHILTAINPKVSIAEAVLPQALKTKDIEETKKPAITWKSDVTLGSALRSGNTNVRSVNTQLESERRSAHDRFSAKAHWDYAEEKSPTDSKYRLSQRRLGGALKYDFFLTQKNYILASTAAEGDELADLDLRYNTSFGWGYQFFETDKVKLRSDAAISYVGKEFDSKDEDSTYLAGRLSYQLDYKLGSKSLFSHALEYFPSLEEQNELYGKIETKLRTYLSETMFAQVQWIANFDNTPSSGRERLDNNYNLALGFGF